MMMHGYRHRGRASRGAFWSVGFGIVAVAVGAYVVYQLIGWFRASNEEMITDVEAQAFSVTTPVTTMVLDGSAAIMLTGGGSVGAVYRRGTSEHAEYNTVLSLPALAPETSYEIWMVKDGLVDVQTAGTLEARADGTFAKVFSIADPAEFSTVVIMTEPNDGVVTPSGTIIAQGSF